MRSILFFDLPVLTNTEKKNYRKFIKSIKKLGFYMLQESVYVKMAIDSQVADSIIKKVKSLSPSKGSVIILTITEKQFSNMNIIIGEVNSDVIVSDQRTLIL